MLVKILPSNEINFVFFTDAHLSAIPIGRRRDDYQQAILDKVNFVKDLCFKVDGVALFGGDCFHYKQPKHPGNSCSLIEKITRIFGSFPEGVVIGAVGNHDIQWDKMSTLPDSPLGILIAAGVYHDLTKQSILFVNKTETFGVLVDAFPYEHDGLKTLERILNAPLRTALAKYRVGIVHQYGALGERGSLWGATKIGYNEVADCDYDFLLWGHDHSRAGINEVGNVTHVQLGSLARAALPTDEDGHPVVATVLRFTEKGAYRPREVPIPTKPLDVAFRTADKGMETVGKLENITDFFQSMDEAVSNVATSEPRDVLIALAGDDKPTLDLALELCPGL
jgi:hypothetical protein